MWVWNVVIVIVKLIGECLENCRNQKKRLFDAVRESLLPQRALFASGIASF